MKLDSDQSAEIKRRWRIIRTDYSGPNGGEIPGDIISADEDSGECSMSVSGETKSYSLGAGGLRIIRRATH